MLEGCYNRKQFLLIRLVVFLSRNEFSRPKGNRMPLAIGLQLRKDSRNSKDRSIYLHPNLQQRVEMHEDRSLSKRCP